jgi:hypothetical protein
MKLLIMQFSPTTCHFISLRSKYSPQHPPVHIHQSKMWTCKGVLYRKVTYAVYGVCLCLECLDFSKYSGRRLFHRKHIRGRLHQNSWRTNWTYPACFYSKIRLLVLFFKPFQLILLSLRCYNHYPQSWNNPLFFGGWQTFRLSGRTLDTISTRRKIILRFVAVLLSLSKQFQSYYLKLGNNHSLPQNFQFVSQ